MGVNSLPKTVTRQRCGCDLNPGPSAPESSTLTTRLPSHLDDVMYTKRQLAWRTEYAAEKTQVGRTGAATGRVVLVDHASLSSLRQRHGQQDRLVELATTRLQRHDWTHRYTVTAHVT